MSKICGIIPLYFNTSSSSSIEVKNDVIALSVAVFTLTLGFYIDVLKRAMKSALLETIYS